MAEAAENLQFEQAAVLRDRIHAVERILEGQKIISTSMEDQDIIYYLQNVVNMLERFDNYSIALLPKDSGNGTAHINFYCIVKEQKSMLLEAYVHDHSYPDVRLVIEEPMVIDACEDYFNEIWEQVPPLNRDKRRVIRLIRNQIDFVKNYSRKCD